MIKQIIFTLFITLPFQVSASTVSFMFSGTIDIADVTALLDDNGINVSVGDTFNGVFSYDTDAPLQADTGLSYRTDYYGTINSNISVTIGDYEYKVANPLGFEMLVYNDDINDNGSDHIAFSTTQALISPFNTDSGHIGINLYDASGLAINNTSIPSIINGDDWLGSHMTIIGDNPDSRFVLSGGIDTISAVSAVPLPPALYLFITGFFGLVVAARKTNRISCG